jgi:hypothetical protein
MTVRLERLTADALRDLAEQVRRDVGAREGYARQCAWANCPTKALEHSGVWCEIAGQRIEVAVCREHLPAMSADVDYLVPGRCARGYCRSQPACPSGTCRRV